MSAVPSPLTSPTATSKGLGPAKYEVAVTNVPSPLFRSTLTVELLISAVTMSQIAVAVDVSNGDVDVRRYPVHNTRYARPKRAAAVVQEHLDGPGPLLSTVTMSGP